MGKRLREQEARQRAADRVPLPPAPMLDEVDDPAITVEKSYATCGNPMCCRRYLSEAQTLDGTPYEFRHTQTMPMICGGDAWLPMPRSMRVKKRATTVPAGFAQFLKKPDDA